MSNKSDYEEKLAVIMAIPDDQVTEPNLPVETAAQEGENTYYWAMKDIEKLKPAGLSVALVEDIPKRTGSLREAESRWNGKINKKKEAEEEWSKKAPYALDKRNEWLHDFGFAYRKDSYLRNRVRAIRENAGYDDLIQDLNDIAVLGKENPEPLKTIGFDLDQLDEAARLSDEMATLLTEVNGDRNSINEAKIIRDKAFTHLKEAVDEVREYGKYVFWRDEERLKRYRSDYFYEINKKRREKEKSDDELAGEKI